MDAELTNIDAIQGDRVNRGPSVKYRDVIKLIEKNGWFLVRTSGSHRVYHHPEKTGNVIVSVHNPGRDVATGTFKAILKQAGIDE